MRFVAGVYQRTPLHGVNALQLGKKIAPLGDLETRLDESVLVFPTVLAGAAENLAGDKKCLNAHRQRVPRKCPAYQIIFVASVTMTEKIRIVFIESNRVVRGRADSRGAVH